MNKLSSEDLSDVLIQGLASSVLTLEKFEIMEQNGLIARKVKQTVKACIPHLTEYIDKVFANFDKEDKLHELRSATYISELVNRMETALSVKNLLTISDRKEMLLEILNKNQKETLYDVIVDSGILNY